MRHGWRKVDDVLFATVTTGRKGARYHLIAERLPAYDGWDWTVWRVGDAPENSRHGFAPGAATAMAAAEGAAWHWETRAAAVSFADD
jgi:hypothetical protein